jgi:ABC-type metal ion transport system substrate-binding protein
VAEETRTVTTVSLFIARYNELVEAERKLNALENYGVDNWDGYSDAMASIKEIKDGPKVVWR